MSDSHISIPKWAFGMATSVALMAASGAFVWGWNTNTVVAALVIEKAEDDDVQQLQVQLALLSRDLEYIRQTIDEVRNRLPEE